MSLDVSHQRTSQLSAFTDRTASATAPAASRTIPTKTAAIANRLDRSVPAGCSRWRSRSSVLRIFARKPKSNRSPSTGTDPTRVSVPRFNNIFARTALGTPSRAAVTTMYPEAAAPARSPRPGKSPRIGSSPIVMPVPGIRMAESSRRATARARAAGSERASGGRSGTILLGGVEDNHAAGGRSL